MFKMFNKINDNERFCFKCPFCGKDDSFGFKTKELRRNSEKEKKFAMEKLGLELPDFQLVESWGCNNCDMGLFSVAENYDKAYLKISESAKGQSTLDVLNQMRKKQV